MHGRVIVGLGDFLEELRLRARLGDVDQSTDNVRLKRIELERPKCGLCYEGTIYLLGSLQLHAHIGTWVSH